MENFNFHVDPAPFVRLSMQSFAATPWGMFLVNTTKTRKTNINQNATVEKIFITVRRVNPRIPFFVMNYNQGKIIMYVPSFCTQYFPDTNIRPTKFVEISQVTFKHKIFSQVLDKIHHACTSERIKLLVYIVSGLLASRGLVLKTSDHQLCLTGIFVGLAKDTPFEQIIQLYGRINGYFLFLCH